MNEDKGKKGFTSMGVNPELWKEVKKEAIRRNIEASKLVEMALRKELDSSKVNNLGYYIGEANPDEIKTTLKRMGKLLITGWSSKEPVNQGEQGGIDHFGTVLCYTHLANSGSWDPIWEKYFYTWRLEWREKYGVVATARWACSPD